MACLKCVCSTSNANEHRSPPLFANTSANRARFMLYYERSQEDILGITKCSISLILRNFLTLYDPMVDYEILHSRNS